MNVFNKINRINDEVLNSLERGVGINRTLLKNTRVIEIFLIWGGLAVVFSDNLGGFWQAFTLIPILPFMIAWWVLSGVIGWISGMLTVTGLLLAILFVLLIKK